MAGIGEMDTESFVSLLRKVIGESKYVQNNPPELVPEEDRVGRHVLEALQPYGVENGGPLIIQHVSYLKGRGNIIVEYPGTVDGKILSFVGCHMDVVTANPEEWVSSAQFLLASNVRAATQHIRLGAWLYYIGSWILKQLKFEDLYTTRLSLRCSAAARILAAVTL